MALIESGAERSSSPAPTSTRRTRRDGHRHRWRLSSPAPSSCSCWRATIRTTSARRSCDDAIMRRAGARYHTWIGPTLLTRWAVESWCRPASAVRGPWAVGSSSLAGTRLSCTMTVQLLSNESSPFLLLDFHFCPCEKRQKTQRSTSVITPAAAHSHSLLSHSPTEEREKSVCDV